MAVDELSGLEERELLIASQEERPSKKEVLPALPSMAGCKVVFASREKGAECVALVHAERSAVERQRLLCEVAEEDVIVAEGC